jgi:hypothetical protein
MIQWLIELLLGECSCLSLECGESVLWRPGRGIAAAGRFWQLRVARLGLTACPCAPRVLQRWRISTISTSAGARAASASSSSSRWWPALRPTAGRCRVAGWRGTWWWTASPDASQASLLVTWMGWNTRMRPTQSFSLSASQVLCSPILDLLPFLTNVIQHSSVVLGMHVVNLAGKFFVFF